MDNKGSVPLSSVQNFWFSSVDTTGADSAVTSVTVRVFKDGDSTQSITAADTAVSINTSFAALVGINRININTDPTSATSANFFAPGSDYLVVVDDASVDGVVTDAVIGTFEIDKNVDGAVWAGPILSIDASGVEVPSGATLARDGNFIITLLDPPNRGRSRLMYHESANTWYVDPGWDAGSETAPSNGSLFAWISIAPASATSTLENVNVEKWNTVTVGNLSTETVAAVNSTVTAQVSGLNADVITAASMAASAGQEIADSILTRNLASGSDHSTRNVGNALRALRNRVLLGASTVSVYEEDDTTVAWGGSITTDGSAIRVTDSNPAGP